MVKSQAFLQETRLQILHQRQTLNERKIKTMAPRKKPAIPTFEDIKAELLEAAHDINTLGNLQNNREIRQRMKTLFEDIIKDIKRIDMLQSFLLTKENTRFLIYKGEDIYEATPNEIMKAFILKWEKTPITYSDEELWKVPEDPNA